MVSKPRIVDDPRWSKKAKRDARAIARRVEMLGQLNDRRLTARGTGDGAALAVIAAEYADIGCLRLANEVLAEAGQKVTDS